MFTVGRDKQQDQIRREPRRSQPGLIALGGSSRRDKRGPGSGPPALRKQPVPSSGRSEPALSRAPPTDRAGALGARGARTRGTAAWAARGREHIHRGRRLWDAVCRGSAVPPRPKTPQTPQNQPKPPGCEHPRERRGTPGVGPAPDRPPACWPRPSPLWPRPPAGPWRSGAARRARGGSAGSRRLAPAHWRRRGRGRKRRPGPAGSRPPAPGGGAGAGPERLRGESGGGAARDMGPPRG